MTIACVVAAVDGSPSSLEAVDWAADEADRRGVRLLLVHACLWERYELPETDEGDPISERSEVHTLLDTALRRAAARHPGLTVEAQVIPEETVDALLGLGRLAPLLVLGSRGRGGFAGLLLGSVSLRVAGRATFPVVIVRQAPQALDRRTGRIVLGLGAHPHGDRAAAFAVEEARLWQAELEVVQAWRERPDRYGFSLGASDRARAAHHQARSAAEQQLNAVALPGAVADEVKVRRSAVEGGAVGALVSAGAVADLIVIGARPRHGQSGLALGAVNHGLLHHAPCPVAVVPAV